jgi:hypothetical protein
MVAKVKLFNLFIILLIFLSCENYSKISESFESRAQKIQDEHIPDLSLNVFTTSLQREDNQWKLAGETTVASARDEILAIADSLLGKNNYQNDFILLPHPTLGDSNYAVVCVSVANLREEPRHSAQLIDQNIMGKTLRLLKNKGGWYLIQTEYGYVGWMRRESFFRTDSAGNKKWQQSDRVRVIGLYPMVYSKAGEQSEPVADVVLNALLLRQSKNGKWIKVRIPDGREGYIQSMYISAYDENKKSGKNIRKDIIKTARSMMGIPYLWGGNSCKANDCSGFTQTVFKANGIDLLRDARQQAQEGTEVIPDENFSNLLPGDLLFFGSEDRVTHVGISIGGPQFIHQSGMVHINSLDPDAENYSPYRRNSLKRIRRVL